MGTPCRKCGSVRTSSLKGWRDLLARPFGYRVKECVGCHRTRWVRRRTRDSERTGQSFVSGKPPTQPEQAAAKVAAPPTEAAVRAAEASPETGVSAEKPNPERHSRRAPCCPYCLSDRVRRSKRRWYERLIGKGIMMRCRECRRRFPEERGELREEKA